jgi:hypothetical protein
MSNNNLNFYNAQNGKELNSENQFFNALQNQEELNKKIKSVENNAKLYSLKQNKKRNISEIFNYIIDKIGQNQKSINLLYDLIKLSNEHSHEQFEGNNFNNSKKLEFIKKYVENQIKEINKNNNIGVINNKYKILIQILKSVYRIQFNESTNEKYSLQKNRLLMLINGTNANNNNINNYSRKALSSNNLQNVLRNAAFAQTMNKSEHNRIVNENRKYIRKISSNGIFLTSNGNDVLSKDKVSTRDKVIAYTSILSNPPPSNNMEGFHNFTLIKYFIYNKKLCGELTNYNDLISYSPFYYSNGLFHINPLAKNYYLENRSELIEYSNNINKNFETKLEQKLVETINLDELMNNIDLLNNSRILTKIFEEKFIYNVKFNSKEFKTNFYTLCEEFNFLIDTVSVYKEKIIDSFSLLSLRFVEKTEMHFTKRTSIFKIQNMPKNKVAIQKGGELAIGTIIGCTIAGSFAVALIASLIQCRNRNQSINKNSYHKCVSKKTIEYTVYILGGIVVLGIAIAFTISSGGMIFLGSGSYSYSSNYSRPKKINTTPLLGTSKYIKKIELMENHQVSFITINFNISNGIIIISNVKLNNFSDEAKIIPSENIIKLIFENSLKNKNTKNTKNKLNILNNNIINICKDLLLQLNCIINIINIHYDDDSTKIITVKESLYSNSSLLQPSFPLKYLSCKEFYGLKILLLEKFNKNGKYNTQIEHLLKSYENKKLLYCTTNK